MSGLLSRVGIGYLLLAQEPRSDPNRNSNSIPPIRSAGERSIYGHLGPWLVAGVRIGTAELRTAGADAYFHVDVNVEGPLALPPQACFLDGLQVATGATLGNGNQKWVEAPRLAVRLRMFTPGKRSWSAQPRR